MIYSSFEGRIGNNLFQLAACLSLAKWNKTEACVGLSGNMKYIKENFLLEDIKFIENDLNGFMYRKLLPEEINNIYIEKSLNYDQSFFDLPNNTFIDGFFQSEKYFKFIEKTIRKNFKFKDHIIEKVEKIKYFLPNITKSGFIHVRRADYLEGNNINAYPLPSIDYYQTCIDEQNLNYIYVFSDDIDWCKKNFKNYNNKNFIFVEESDPYISLYMMSQLNIAIIANSTFSWWGAWLNSNKKKIVYCPKIWIYENFLKSQYNITLEEHIKDLICENWIIK